jgi:hypothetical protein
LIGPSMIQSMARARLVSKDARFIEPQPIGGRLLAALVALALAGCMPAMAPAPPASTTPVGQCLAKFEALDVQIAGNGVPPSSPRRIEGFPYLRTDRFLASFRDDTLSENQFDAWWWHLAAADRDARRIERDSLPASVARRFAELESCYAVMARHDRGQPQRQALIRANAKVPDEYVTVAQVIGLYPLTGWAVRAGIARYQASQHARFAVPLEQLPVQGELRRFHPPESTSEPSQIGLTEVDPLGIPLLSNGQLDTLFAHHAPVWEIDVTGDQDLPGQPIRHADGSPGVDPSEPLVYRYTSHTRWQGRSLLQLNYLIWFDRRPRVGPLDLLGGPLDGVLWRVTLDTDGAPLLYDSIHPCGCYHLFLPTDRLRQDPTSLRLPEPPLIPQAAPSPGAGERMVLRLASGSHYLERVYADQPSGTYHGWQDYSALYATPNADNIRSSLFRADGIVAGTERAERYLLWPTGVLEPGAMRERGRQAIAFLGRRHFDDADLLDRLFRPAE